MRQCVLKFAKDDNGSALAQAGREAAKFNLSVHDAHLRWKLSFLAPTKNGAHKCDRTTGDVYSSEEEVRDFCVSPLRVPEPCRLAERSPV
jgi:hypothetical protein